MNRDTRVVLNGDGACPTPVRSSWTSGLIGVVVICDGCVPDLKSRVSLAQRVDMR